MKHCVLMTVYKDYDLINKIISSLPKDWGIFVHIDKKSNIEDIKNDKKKTDSISSRLLVSSSFHE